MEGGRESGRAHVCACMCVHVCVCESKHMYRYTCSTCVCVCVCVWQGVGTGVMGGLSILKKFTLQTYNTKSVSVPLCQDFVRGGWPGHNQQTLLQL